MAIVFQNKSTSLGNLKIGIYENRLVCCDWAFRKMRASIDTKISNFLKERWEEGEHALIEKTFQQIEEYVSGTRNRFELDYQLIGTEFQKEVWLQLLEIPYGKTLSYEGLAQKMDNPKAVRAVATANGANTLALLIPCHRVIGKNRKLVGYAGGLSIKKKLLKIEGTYPFGGQLSLF